MKSRKRKTLADHARHPSRPNVVRLETLFPSSLFDFACCEISPRGSAVPPGSRFGCGVVCLLFLGGEISAVFDARQARGCVALQSPFARRWDGAFVPLYARIETSFPASLVQKNAHAGGPVDPCVFYPGVWICGPGPGREEPMWAVWGWS